MPPQLETDQVLLQQDSSSAESTTCSSTRNYVLCPTSTYDYRIEKRAFGYCLVANRDMRKGESVFGESLEFCFRQVQEGDVLLLTPGEFECDSDKPICLPLNRHVLMETHGLGMLEEPDDTTTTTTLVEKWHLESPGMLMNHSCDPTVVITKFDWEEGEGLAARDIQQGDELTCDYAFFDYEEAGSTFECQCGAQKCRGKRIGFNQLDNSEKEALLQEYPDGICEAVKARHQHALGKGPEVLLVEETPKPRLASAFPRLVIPGPSTAEAETIAIRPCQPTLADNSIVCGLVATQDIEAGDCVFWFWAQPWPTFPGIQAASPVELIAALDIEDNDLPEGTLMAHVDPRLVAPRHATTGQYEFTSLDLLIHHSCQPNLVYKWKSQQDDNWRGVYACRDIQAGEPLSVDFNTKLWTRPMSPCHCGADNCRGLVGGFANLDPMAQEDLKGMNWKRQSIACGEEEEEEEKGQALSPYIQKQLQEAP